MVLRLFIIILLLASANLHAHAGRPKKSGLPVNGSFVNVCNPLLGAHIPMPRIACPSGFCQRVYNLFDAGLDNEAEILAYVGISQHQMIELLKTGEINITIVPSKQFPLDKSGHDELIKVASNDASARHSVDLVLNRINNLTGKKPTADQAMYDHFYNFIDHLLIENGTRNNKVTLTFESLLEALDKLKIEFVEPSYISNPINFQLEMNVGISSDYTEHVRYQKLRKIFRWLDLPFVDVENPGSLNRQLFLTFFASLPAKEGFILGLNTQFKMRDSYGKNALAQATKIRLADIVGVDPVSNEGFNLLRDLKPAES